MPYDASRPRTDTSATPRPAPSWAKKPPPKSKASARAKAKIGPRRYTDVHDRDDHARLIAERVTETWHKSGSGDFLGIPLGTVAALALLRNRPGLDEWILALKPNELPPLFKEIFFGYWTQRPDLINRALPLHDWTWNPQPDTQQLHAVHTVTHTALTAGLMNLTGGDDPYERSETDIFSNLLMGMRHNSALKGLGEIHTPPGVCNAMANVVIAADDLAPGMSFVDPCVGTGQMLRSAAQRVRDLGHNPYDFRWFGNDINPLAAACAAINTLIWDLGPRARIGCSDTLTTPDGGYTKALTEAREAFEERDRHLDTARGIVRAHCALRLSPTTSTETNTTP